MDLIPESIRALQELVSTEDDAGVLVSALEQTADAVVDAVPLCVGMSVTFVQDGRSVTFLATATGVAVLDAVQFLDGGPCEDSLARHEELLVEDLLSEERWALFARAAAVTGVSSTLSMPLRSAGTVVGGVNLYASSSDAFDDRYREVAGIFGATASEVVRNADLSMSVRARAERAEADLHDQAVVDQAVGVLVAQRGIAVPSAQALLTDAAARAGTTEVQVAALLVQLR